MNALVDLIKRIGIFMIAAQAVIHFAPDIKYAKYMKLIVGILVLLQFLSPVYKIVNGMESNWDEKISDIEQELGIYEISDELSGSYSASESVAESIGREIKYRLNNALSSDDSVGDYTVTNVMIELERTGENDDNAAGYKLNKIRVIVWESTKDTGDKEHISESENTGSVNNIGKIDKIQIDKIDITENNMEENGNEITDNLRRMFCGVLGVEEKYMEVVVYGAH